VAHEQDSKRYQHLCNPEYIALVRRSPFQLASHRLRIRAGSDARKSPTKKFAIINRTNCPITFRDAASHIEHMPNVNKW
jgi:hypothetical protein